MYVCIESNRIGSDGCWYPFYVVRYRRLGMYFLNYFNGRSEMEEDVLETNKIRCYTNKTEVGNSTSFEIRWHENKK